MDHCSKSNEKSENLKTEGNKLFVEKKFFDAILKYNESLCYAEQNSDNSGFAYANRSAVYFEMKLYEKSLNNIELAKANNYPEKNIGILNKREEKCREMMTKNANKSTSTDDFNFFKLSHVGHKNSPTIVSCLQLKCDKKYGRHIVTNKSLAVGDIIAIEEPFCKVVKEKFIYQRCANCFKSNLLDLQPCFNCNQAMFCSHDCAEIGLKNFHRWECPIINLISSCFINLNMRVALRIFFMSLTIFDDSIEELQKFINENSPSNVTMFDFEMKLNMKQKLLAINSSTFDDSLEFHDIIFEDLFNLNHKLKEMWSSHKDFIRKFLKKQTQIAALNCHEIYGWPLKKGGLNEENENNQNPFAYRPTIVPYANGCYPFCLLLNHSCAPNICRIFIDGKIYLIVQRKIDAGSQIFDNYGCYFTNYNRDLRQKKLLKQYKFNCECEACVNDIGLLPTLKICDKDDLAQAQNTYDDLLTIDQKGAQQKYKEIAKIIQNSKEFPSLEVCNLIGSFLVCLEKIIMPELFFS